MKKNLLYLFALICSMSLFTACSDDDDPNWKKLPSEEISAENLTLTTNSKNLPGATVKLAMTDAQNGILTLNNAIRGINEVEVNVTVAEETDGSFKFQGEKSVGAATKAVSDLVSSTTVKVAGKISLEGKAEVTVTTEATGNLVKKWVLCDELYFEEGVKGIAHAPVRLDWVSTHTDSNGGNVGLATENISLVGSNALSCIMIKLLKDVEFKADGAIVANYAKDIELNMDEIIGGAMGGGFPSTENVTWLTSPANLASWYVDGNYIRVVLDIPAIVAEATKDDESAGSAEGILAILDMIKGLDGAKIKELLGAFLSGMGSDNVLSKLDISKISDADVEMLIGYLTDGFPVSYQVSDVTLSNDTKIKNVYVYLDKGLLDIFMPALYPALPDLDKLVKTIEIGMYGTKMPLWGLLQMLTGLNSLTELEDIWKSTTKFTFGIDLASGSYKVEKE